MATEEQIKAIIDADHSALTTEYTEWNKAQGLNLGSADEHLFDEDLTDAQREWLADFCERWEQAAPYFGRNGMSARKLDGCEVMLFRTPAEWADFLAKNDGDLGIPTDEALAAAKSVDGLRIGGGAAAEFFIRYLEA